MAGPSIDILGNLRLTNSSLRSSSRQVQSAFNNINVNPARLNKFDNALGRITGRASEFSKSMNAATARVFAFGATVTVLNSVSQSFRALINSTIEVEKKMVEINSIFGGTQAQLQSFRKSIFDVAKNTEQSFDLVAEGMVELARQGLSVEESGKRLNAALILSRRSGLEAAASVNAVTAAINGFVSANLRAEQVTNKIVAVDTAFAVSAKDLADGIARAGSTAEDAGVSFDQLLGAITAIQQRTQRGGAVIGNAFKTILPRINRERSLRQLQDLGVDIDISQDGIERLIAISEALERITDPVSRNKIQEIAGGVRQINIVSALLKDLQSDQSVFAEATEKSAKATNEAYVQNEKLNKTLSAQINALIVGMTDLGSKIGNITLAPILKDLTQFSRILTSGLGQALGPDSGSKIIKPLFEGIATFIKGPGLALVFGAFLNITKIVTKFALQGLKDLTRLAGSQEKVKNIEEGIVFLLRQDEQFRQQINNRSLTQAQREQAVIQAIQKENALLSQQQALVSRLALTARSAGVGNFNLQGGGFTGRRGRRFASGFTPMDGIAEVIEAKSLGAKGKVKPRMGRGRIGGKKFLMNNQEFEIPNFGKNGDSLVIPRYADGNLTFNLGSRFRKELEEARARATPLPSLREFEKRFVDEPLGIPSRGGKTPSLRQGGVRTFTEREFNKAFPTPPTPVPARTKQAPTPISRKRISEIISQRRIQEADRVIAAEEARRSGGFRGKLKSGTSNVKSSFKNIATQSANSGTFGIGASLAASIGIPVAGELLKPTLLKDINAEVETFARKVQSLNEEIEKTNKETNPKKFEQLNSELAETEKNLQKVTSEQQKYSNTISNTTSQIGLAAIALSNLPKNIAGPLAVSAAAFRGGQISGSRANQRISETSINDNVGQAIINELSGINEIKNVFSSELSGFERFKAGISAFTGFGQLGRIGSAAGSALGLIGGNNRLDESVGPPSPPRRTSLRGTGRLADALVKASETVLTTFSTIKFENQSTRNFNTRGVRGRNFQLNLQRSLNDLIPSFSTGGELARVKTKSAIDKRLARSTFDTLLNQSSQLLSGTSSSEDAAIQIKRLDETIKKLSDPKFAEQGNEDIFRRIQGSGLQLIQGLQGLGLDEKFVDNLKQEYQNIISQFSRIEQDNLLKRAEISIKEIEDRRELNNEFISNLSASFGSNLEGLERKSSVFSGDISRPSSDLFKRLLDLGIRESEAQSATTLAGSNSRGFINNIIGGAGTDLRTQLFQLSEAGLLENKLSKGQSSLINSQGLQSSLNNVIESLFKEQGSFAGLQGLQKAKSGIGNISSFGDIARIAGLLRSSTEGISELRGRGQVKGQAAVEVARILEQLESVLQVSGKEVSESANEILKQRDASEAERVKTSILGRVPESPSFGETVFRGEKEFQSKKVETEIQQLEQIRQQVTEYSKLGSVTRQTKNKFNDLLSILEQAETALNLKSQNEIEASQMLLDSAKEIRDFLGNNPLGNQVVQPQ